MNLLKHKLNKHIRFDKESHTYYYKGEPFQGVTKWISSYGEPFDKKRMAKVMAWKEGKTEDEILQLWQDLNEYGNEVHDIIEYYINDGVEADRVELEIFKECCKEINITPIAGEFVIYDKSIKRASPVDILAERDGKIVVVDLKTMFKPLRYLSYKSRSMVHPLQDLPDSAYYKYSLQTSIYQKWLSEIYGADVDETAYIFHIHQDVYEIIPTLNLIDKVNLMYNDPYRNS